MTDVIQILYDNQCCKQPETTPELAELYQQEREVFDKIHAALGLKALDQLNCAQSQISHILELDCFRKGFLLGAALILELKLPSSPQKTTSRNSDHLPRFPVEGRGRR
jgi:hypothetical protein